MCNFVVLIKEPLDLSDFTQQGNCEIFCVSIQFSGFHMQLACKIGFPSQMDQFACKYVMQDAK